MTYSLRNPIAKKILLLLALFLLLTGQTVIAKPKLPAWDVFASQFIETYLIQHPPFAANAGRHEFDGKLPDWSPSGLKKESQWLKAERKIAVKYREITLKASERFKSNYLLALIDKDLFWLNSTQAPYKNPMFYYGALDPNFYVNHSYAPIEQRMRAFIDFARQIPKATAQIQANLKLPLPRTYIDMSKTVFGGLAKFYQQDAKLAFAKIVDLQLQKQFDEVVPVAANR